MLGFFKKMLRNPQRGAAETNAATVPPAAEEPSQSSEAAPSPRPSAFRKTSAGNAGRGMELPLQSILAGLPLELQPRVRLNDVGDLSISVPLEKILAQLSRGTVKISFGELRQAVPEVFTAQNDRDRVLVPLPLNDILSRLNPNLIARRRVQRQVQVPTEIASPFQDGGQGLIFSVGPNKAPASETPAAPSPRQTSVASAAPATGARSTLTNVPKAAPPTLTPPPPMPAKKNGLEPSHLAPAPEPIKMSPITPLAPAAPVSAAPPAAPAPAVPLAPRPPIPLKTPPAPAAPAARARVPNATAAPAVAKPKSPARPEAVKPAPAAISPASEPKPAPQAAPAPVPQPSKPAAAEEQLLVPLSSLAEGWPEAVRKEIIEANLVEAKVGLPLNSVEQSLKQGRIVFTWKMLRSWLKPAVPQSASTHDGQVLDLPLKVVAPAFLARQKQAAKSQQKVQVDEDIPNLFFGFPQPETGIPVAQATAKPADTNFYVWDDASDRAKLDETDIKHAPSPGTKFVAKYATPNEVVSKAAALDGVAGALIALPDGLMVANRLPADLNAETIAAFLPQIFGKVSQCTKELRMGDLNNLNFTVGNVPWKIFRVNAIFFAAFGRAGEPLPTAQLAALAAELDHKPK